MATFDELGIDVPARASGNVKVKCPECTPTRRNKGDKSLSVNVADGTFCCHHCGWSGKAFEAPKHTMKKEFARPTPIELPLSDKKVAWFKSRGIEPETLQYFRVSECEEWMPQKGDVPAGVRRCINFNYYREKQLINIKYRDAHKAFRMVKDAELILYNLDAVVEREEMLVCEGEIDCMTYYQSGYFGAVSVPNGASKGNAKLEYLDNCWQVFENKKKIIIAVDSDEAGKFLESELIRRLGRERCWTVAYPEGCKDANDALQKHGIESVRNIWKNATPPKLEGIIDISDMEGELWDIYENGWPEADGIGYTGFDQLLKWRRSELTIVTGIPGHGKDEFIDQTGIRLAARHGWKIGRLNFEEPPFIQAIKLAQRYVGDPYYRKDPNFKMKGADRQKAMSFINDHFKFFDITKADPKVDGVLRLADQLVLRYNIDMLVISPWNCMEHSRPDNLSETEYVSQILTKLKNFALTRNIHIVLVAHPTKMKRDRETKKYEVPTLYDISGSAHFFNKTDNGICVYRNYDDNTTDVYIQKVKFFFVGKIGFQTFQYHVDTGRYYEAGTAAESEIKIVAEREKQNTPQLINDNPETEKKSVYSFPAQTPDSWYQPTDSAPF